MAAADFHGIRYGIDADQEAPRFGKNTIQVILPIRTSIESKSDVVPTSSRDLAAGECDVITIIDTIGEEIRLPCRRTHLDDELLGTVVAVAQREQCCLRRDTALIHPESDGACRRASRQTGGV